MKRYTELFETFDPSGGAENALMFAVYMGNGEFLYGVYDDEATAMEYLMMSDEFQEWEQEVGLSFDDFLQDAAVFGAMMTAKDIIMGEEVTDENGIVFDVYDQIENRRELGDVLSTSDLSPNNQEALMMAFDALR